MSTSVLTLILTPNPGLIALVSTSVISGLDILDVIDVGTGGLLKGKM